MLPMGSEDRALSKASKAAAAHCSTFVRCAAEVSTPIEITFGEKVTSDDALAFARLCLYAVHQRDNIPTQRLKHRSEPKQGSIRFVRIRPGWSWNSVAGSVVSLDTDLVRVVRGAPQRACTRAPGQPQGDDFIHHKMGPRRHIRTGARRLCSLAAVVLGAHAPEAH